MSQIPPVVLRRANSSKSSSSRSIPAAKRVLPQEPLLSRLELDATLPDDAEFTSYRTDFMELWLDPDDDTAAYLVFARHVERWPKSKGAIACS